MLPQIERPALVLMGYGTYKYIDNMKKNLSDLFISVGIDSSDFKPLQVLSVSVKWRRKKLFPNTIVHPEDIRKAHKNLKKSKHAENTSDKAVDKPGQDDKSIIIPKCRPGRPPGSKNKKTLEREAAEKLHNNGIQKSKRNPGRPSRKQEQKDS